MTTETVDSPLAQGTANTTPRSFVNAVMEPGPMFFFEPATGVIYECPAESAAPVRAEIALLDKRIDELLCAQAATAAATAHVQAAETKVDSAAQHAASQALTKALTTEGAKREAMFKEFKELPKWNDGASGLLEMLPLATHKGQKLQRTRRMTYVRSSKVKNHFRHYANLPGDAAKLKSFYKPDDKGNYKLDIKKFQEALKTIKPKSELGKHEFPSWVAGWAPEFVAAFNETHNADEAKKRADKQTPENACAQFSGGAAFLRFFAGVGCEVGVDLSSKSFKELLQGRGEVGAKLTGTARAGMELASGMVNASLYLPAKKGLNLQFPAGRNAKGGHQELNLGYVRLRLDGELSASCGASVVAEGAIEFKLKADMTQGMTGAKSDKTAAAIANPKTKVKDEVFSAEASGKAELSAFAGAEAGAKVSGALQWQKAQMLDFSDFAKINAEGKAQAGIGGTAMFEIGYEEGKFKIKTKLAACVGLGLKGSVNAEVGIATIVEFDLWFKHQVFCAIDQNLQYFRKEAFETFVYMKALAIAEGRRLVDYLGQDLVSLLRRWQYLVANATEATLRAIESSRDEILTSVAEAKALVVGLLERMAIRLREFRERIQRAMRHLMGYVQLLQEANNVYQRVGVEFVIDVKGDTEAGRERVARLMGDPDGVELAALEGQMKTEPTPGYQLAMVESAEYQFQRGGGTYIAWQRTPFGESNSQIA